MKIIRAKAHAKINLGLGILGKRADGYHELLTTFATIGLFDELTFTSRTDGKIVVSVLSEGGARVRIPTRENLVYRAARLLKPLAPKGAGVTIVLTKKIPLGAGLGGGSSDAATTLTVLNRLWRLRLSLAELENLASRLGSDAPFFIRGGVQIGHGRGEILALTTLPRDHPRVVVLVCPPFHISTAEAYGNLRFQISNLDIVSECNMQHAIFNASVLRNDFEPTVFAQHPLLAEIKQTLQESGAAAALSGSGATVFGLFARRPTARMLALFAHYGRVVVTHLV